MIYVSIVNYSCNMLSPKHILASPLLGAAKLNVRRPHPQPGPLGAPLKPGEKCMEHIGNHRKIMGNHRKIMRNHRKIGNIWEKYGKS